MKVEEIRKLRLSEKQDRRIKLTSEEKAEIIKKYQTGEYSHRDLAKQYKVCRTTISYIVNPMTLEKMHQRTNAYRKEHPVDFEKRNERERNRYKYKKELYEKGELK